MLWPPFIFSFLFFHNICATTSQSLVPEWIVEIGTTTSDLGYGIAVENNNYAYVVGETDGLLGEYVFGFTDIVIIKLDVLSEGKTLWITQTGSTATDGGYACAIDPISSSLYVTGIIQIVTN